MMPVGMLLMLFSLKFKLLNEDRHHKSLGIAPSMRLQPARSSVFKKNCRLLKVLGRVTRFSQLLNRKAQGSLRSFKHFLFSAWIFVFQDSGAESKRGISSKTTSVSPMIILGHRGESFVLKILISCIKDKVENQV